MKKKLLTFLITGIMISGGAQSQTVKDNLDNLYKDPKTQERAAKADVLMHKKVISDTTKITPVKTVVRTQGVSKVKHKKRKHKLKLKKPTK